ncbi:MAG: hypothetical protein ACJ796_22920 [Gemmatimonadaceae bacterium]
MSASSRPTPVETTAATPPFVRRRPLPALGLPRGRENRRVSATLSLLFHVLIVMLLVTPFAVHRAIIEREQGAGGPGPVGGGGGGHSGTGGAEQGEEVQFIRVAPQAATPAPTPPAVVVPPAPVPPPLPVKNEPTSAPPMVQQRAVEVPAAKLPDVAATPGAGGGTGHDGSNGTGPGSGGGVGTGVGTGRGSGVGPGTGGGTQDNYAPTVLEMFIPPLPVPDKVRGSKIVAEFDVDSTGRVLAYDFTPTKDGAYNKRLAEVLRGFRFRAGTTPQGQPLRMKTQISLFLP